MATTKNANVPENPVENHAACDTAATEPVNAPAPEVQTITAAPEKKTGFFRDMGVGVKIGVGLVFGALAFGAGFLVKKVFFSGSNAEDPIEVDGTVTGSEE